jgi:hypothetical protein
VVIVAYDSDCDVKVGAASYSTSHIIGYLTAKEKEMVGV